MTSWSKHPHPESLYYHIAVDALNESKKYKVDESNEVEFKRKECITIVLVFSALFLEAFINQEYAKLSLEHKLAKRQTLESKWVDLPRHLGKTYSFNLSGTPYTTFQDIISTRNNRLVHVKPHEEDVDDTTAPPLEYWGELVGNTDKAQEYVNCIKEMVTELHILTGCMTSSSDFLDNRIISRIEVSASGFHESLQTVTNSDS